MASGRRLVGRSGQGDFESSEQAIQLDIYSACVLTFGWFCANLYVLLSAYSFCERVKVRPCRCPLRTLPFTAF